MSSYVMCHHMLCIIMCYVLCVIRYALCVMRYALYVMCYILCICVICYVSSCVMYDHVLCESMYYMNVLCGIMYYVDSYLV